LRRYAKHHPPRPASAPHHRPPASAGSGAGAGGGGGGKAKSKWSFKPAPSREVPDFDALHDAFFRRLQSAREARPVTVGRCRLTL
jgi:protein FAM161A